VAAIELVKLAGQYSALNMNETSGKQIEIFLKSADGFYKNYYEPIDKDIFVAMMKAYYNNVPKQYHFDELSNKLKKHNGSFEQWADEAYSQSVFRSYPTLHKTLTTLSKKNINTVENDPFIAIYRSVRTMLDAQISAPYMRLSQQLDSLSRIYIAAQMLTDKQRIFYPDANQTLRIAFGKVEGYSPVDAVEYLPYTTLEGVMEKDNPNIDDYRIPQELKTAYSKGDFDRYADYDTNKLPVCFIASNHTSGGNSGSPVFNSNGELLGLNFDRNWEGTMSDVLYDPSQCRNIIVDIRYVLFVTDKVYGAKWLVDEMKLKCPCEE
jgi:hypothetical protein